ncbi:hypothetical protein EOI76_11735 [Salmonella enterica]|nr:hypothetical protein [Salmonella enterica]EAR4676638.1 hypothetical protein [Salmonella enterica]EAU2111452.1 hypothetical protein [Salmonella enterica]EAU9844962.1 hypothetical protein [Salmonella enterica]EBI8322749.1 hypothetical protein [Salmonella enterica]
MYVALCCNLITFSFQSECGNFYCGLFRFLSDVYILRSILEMNFDLFHKELDGFYVFYGFKFFN